DLLESAQDCQDPRNPARDPARLQDIRRLSLTPVYTPAVLAPILPKSLPELKFLHELRRESVVSKRTASLVAPACLLFSTLVAASVNPAVGPKQAHPQIDVSRMGTHEKQVAAVTRIVAKLFERTLYPVRGDAPQVLQFEVPDSRYRYLIFCFSTVHTVCARRMKNPDAVLNECQYKLLGGAITYQGTDG